MISVWAERYRVHFPTTILNFRTRRTLGCRIVLAKYYMQRTDDFHSVPVPFGVLAEQVMIELKVHMLVIPRGQVTPARCRRNVYQSIRLLHTTQASAIPYPKPFTFCKPAISFYSTHVLWCVAILQYCGSFCHE